MHLHRDSHTSNEYGQKKPLAMVFPNIYSLWHTINININTFSPIGTTIWYVCVQSGISVENRITYQCDHNNSAKLTKHSSNQTELWSLRSNLRLEQQQKKELRHRGRRIASEKFKRTQRDQFNAKNHNLQSLDRFTFRVSLYLIIAAASLSNHIGVFFFSIVTLLSFTLVDLHFC